MRMKLVFLMLSLMPIGLYAIPVVNENVANSGTITIYPDSHEKNRFYVAPNVVMIALNEKNVPLFSYQEFTKGSVSFVENNKRVTHFVGITGLAHFELVPAYTRNELEQAKVEILKKNPEAEFSGVPFLKSELSLNRIVSQLITDSSCNHITGLIGQEQSCTLTFSPIGRMAFLRAIEKRMLFTTLQFEYEIQAVVRLSDGTFKDQIVKHGVASRIDGDQLANYPDLIMLVDSKIQK